MLPRIAQVSASHGHYLAFLDELRACGFKGDLNADYANRVVQATDNSIYQILPQAVVYPKDKQDLLLIAQLSNQARFHDIVLGPRGGGTGTNGQSLTDGLIVDLSKHMNGILEINSEERWVRVQAGVVKDQLNVALQPYGLFFAPELSPSNRATIGGMINTDASGQGSCRYGKTRDHVLELESVFLDGTLWRSGPVSAAELADIKRRDDRVGELHRVVDRVVSDNAALIDERFPRLNRCLTGYDLAHVHDGAGRFNLNSILCGAEGTLAFIAEARLNLMPLPEHVALVNVRYATFEDTLRDTRELMKSDPAAIESIDSIVLDLAMNDIIWDAIGDLFPSGEGPPIRGINLVEFIADTEEDLRSTVKVLTDQLDALSGQRGKCIGYTVAYGHAQLNRVWEMRKKAVGLLGNVQGERRPIPFVEDTAVPPENLADYIMEFRAILEREHLAYGMFGHVDAGVLHVRPAIDMKDPGQEKLIRKISDEVAALTRKYKGLLWGEHGKGVRSEYAPEFFGPLYPCLQRIKSAGDPRNQLNPGKICTPSAEMSLLKIDGVPTRGQLDRRVPAPVRDEYAGAMTCNGNGQCYNFDPDDPMCPSWKGTRERIHSPKGRASLTREWVRLLAEQGVDPITESREAGGTSLFRAFPSRLRNTLARRRGEYDFSHEVYAAMRGCLACKCCATQCPVRVDVPEFRSKFLELYYGRYLRPARDYIVASLESALPLMSRFSGAYNWALENGSLQKFMRDFVGLVDNPRLSGVSLDAAARDRGVARASPEALESLPAQRRERAVIVVQDAFTRYFETHLVIDILDLLRSLGFVPLLAPFVANGKPLHVHGFLSAFNEAAARNAAMLKELESHGVPLVGVDPSMTLTYRSEYTKALGTDAVPRVQLIQEWLATHTEHLRGFARAGQVHPFKLLAHCTEKTTAASSMRDWQGVFAALGQSLEVVHAGCCGMAGTYGHEAANVDTSKRIYALSWSRLVNDPAHRGALLATGYSCRSQVKRIDGQALQHPAQALLSITQAPERSAANPHSLRQSGQGSAISTRGSINRGCC